jgi:hypothetical protein
VYPIRHRKRTILSWRFDRDRDGDASRDEFISLSLLKTALSQFAFHSDDMSLFKANFKSQAGNNKSVC